MSKHNIIPKIQPIHIDMRGENYAFNGCGRLVMDNLGESDYNYSFFAGLTGDNFTQFYPYHGIPNHGCRKARGESATDYRVGKAYIENIFAEIGYLSEFVTAREVFADKEHFTCKLLKSIDRGVPVIQFNYYWSALVGYENDGDIILRIVHEDTEPTRFSLGAELFDTLAKPGDAWQDYCAWVFIGEKTEQKNLASLYRNAILRLPKLLTTKTDDYCFGAQAFREWANEIERGEIFADGMTDDNKWWDYCNYVCNFETNAYCCHGFLQKAKELNPDLAFLDKVSELYKSMSTELTVGGGLEQFGGGFNVTYEVLQNLKKRKAIADKLREYAVNVDEVVRMITDKKAEGKIV